MKKLLFLLVAILTVFVLLGLFVFNWWSENIKPVSADPTISRVTIVRGASAERIANQLYEEGMIRSPLAFKIFVQINGKADKIQPGVFNMSPAMSLSDIVEKLLGRPDEISITIIEGKRREEVAEIVIAGLELSGLEAETFRNEFMAESAGKEGFLFPNTYNFLPGTSANQVVNRLNSTLVQVAENLGSDFPLGYNINQVVILASLIEREAKTKEERPVIAGILYNRLRLGWPLQVDATVQYALADVNCSGVADCNWWPVISVADYRFDSLYNTYQHLGLPPGPIANPGLDSLEAAVNPTETEYMFYLHGTDGVIRYAQTNQEHNENIRQYINR